ncbi:MAG: 2OG-Fe dioxygenase family protein [bacterium]
MSSLNHQLKQRGYQICLGAHPLQRELQQHYRHSFTRFAQSWDYLRPDRFLRDHGHYRWRRYSVFTWQSKRLHLLAHEPHFQQSQYNGIHGGFYRLFAAWMKPTFNNPVLYRIVQWVTMQISPHPKQAWRIQAHQFRITANPEESGKPTPEGMHKDGADYVLIMLLNRENVQGGTSHIYSNQKQLLDEVCLQQAGDLLLINDQHIYHDVSNIYPKYKTQAAWRDVLVLTFHRA